MRYQIEKAMSRNNYSDLISSFNKMSNHITELTKNQIVQGHAIHKILNELECPSVYLNNISEYKDELSRDEMRDLYSAIEWTKNRLASGRSDFKKIVRDACAKEIAQLSSIDRDVNTLIEQVSESSSIIDGVVKNIDKLFNEANTGLASSIEKTFEIIDDNISLRIDDIKNNLAVQLKDIKAMSYESHDAIELIRESSKISDYCEDMVSKIEKVAYDLLDDIDEAGENIKNKNQRLLDDVKSAVSIVAKGIKPLDDKINRVLTGRFPTGLATDARVESVQVNPVTPGRNNRRK